MLDEAGTELVPCPLSHLFYTAESDQRLPPRFVQWHAGAPVLLDLLIDMKADLVIEPILKFPPAAERTEPPQYVTKRARKPSQLTGVTSRTRLIARDMRRHCASDSLRWRRPRAVNE